MAPSSYEETTSSSASSFGSGILNTSAAPTSAAQAPIFSVPSPFAQSYNVGFIPSSNIFAASPLTNGRSKQSLFSSNNVNNAGGFEHFFGNVGVKPEPVFPSLFGFDTSTATNNNGSTPFGSIPSTYPFGNVNNNVKSETRNNNNSLFGDTQSHFSSIFAPAGGATNNPTPFESKLPSSSPFGNDSNKFASFATNNNNINGVPSYGSHVSGPNPFASSKAAFGSPLSPSTNNGFSTNTTTNQSTPTFQFPPSQIFQSPQVSTPTSRGKRKTHNKLQLCPKCGHTFKEQQLGTRVTPYSRTRELESLSCDGFSNNWFNSISAMHVYNDKSHEELRWQDYQLQGKSKNNAQNSSSATGGILAPTFGQQQPPWTLPGMPFLGFVAVPWTSTTPASQPTFGAPSLTNPPAYAVPFMIAPVFGQPSLAMSSSTPGVLQLTDMFL